MTDELAKSGHEEKPAGRLKMHLARFMTAAFVDKRMAQMSLVALALLVGVASGHAAVAFYVAVDGLLTLFFNETEAQLASHVRTLPWWHLVLIPTAAGLIIGQVLRRLDSPALGSVPQVIEAVALKGGRMPFRDGLLSAGATILALAAGSSTGREGPVVHFGASVASGMTRLLGLTPAVARTLMGCAVAAAVAASFNAPFAGVFFALEVIIGHYALHAFAPIVIAAIAGTITSRAYLGDYPAFTISDYVIASPWEFPAFFLLGIAAAGLAVAFTRATLAATDFRDQKLAAIPFWLQPGLGGLLIGLIALAWPEILSVGYEATSRAISGTYDFTLLVSLIGVKLVATLIALVSRFGSGVFSPSLFLGAMLGGSIGIVAAALVPDLASSSGVYAIAGMGAVSSAVLGAPISTILIVFEITGDYSITLAVMVASAVASVTSHLMGTSSFFHATLARRGICLEGGRATWLLKSSKVADHMDRDFFTIRDNEPGTTVRSLLMAQDGSPLVVTNETGKMVGLVSLTDLSDDIFDTERARAVTAQELAHPCPHTVKANAPLEAALNCFDITGEATLPVLSSVQEGVVIGLIRQRVVMAEYNRALLESQGRDEADTTRL